MKTLQELIDAVQHVDSHEPAELIYRLYHDEFGNPLFYSMEHCPDIKYVDITPEQFAVSNSHVKVIDGQIVERSFLKPKLTPDQSQGYLCHSNNVALIQPESEFGRRWSYTDYDQY